MSSVELSFKWCDMH